MGLNRFAVIKDGSIIYRKRNCLVSADRLSWKNTFLHYNYANEFIRKNDIYNARIMKCTFFIENMVPYKDFKSINTDGYDAFGIMNSNTKHFMMGTGLLYGPDFTDDLLNPLTFYIKTYRTLQECLNYVGLRVHIFHNVNNADYMRNLSKECGTLSLSKFFSYRNQFNPDDLLILCFRLVEASY